MSLSAAVGAPAPVKIGETTYTASPVELYDFGALEESVRAAIIHNATIAAVGMSESAKNSVMDDAHCRALRISFFSDEVKSYIASFRGAVGMIVTSIRFKHPDVNEEQIGRTLARNTDQMNEAVALVSRISGFSTENGEQGGTSKGEAPAGG